MSHLALLGLCVPHPDGLVVGAGGDEAAVSAHPHHAHPLPVPGEGLHAVPASHVVILYSYHGYSFENSSEQIF